jgi:hypothetical protein
MSRYVECKAYHGMLVWFMIQASDDTGLFDFLMLERNCAKRWAK